MVTLNRLRSVALALAAFFALVLPVHGVVIINELDSDTPGTDAAEFVELYDGGVGNTSLTGLVLVFYNGSSDLSYAAFDLDGFSTNVNGYFVLGNTGIAGVDVIFAGNVLQNGQDAVALYTANATDFPLNTPVTTANLVDAVVYDTSDADDPGLLVLLNAAQPQVDENANANSANESIRRCPNGVGGARNTSTYGAGVPTPDAASSGCPLPSLNISDVSQVETNAGTTFTFVVTLSAVSGTDVTFDIDTADGTAQDGVPGTDDDDYVSASVADATILAGSTGPYNFNVTVNGDTDVESDENFFANVTGVTGATNPDGQGEATIQNDDVPATPTLSIDDVTQAEGDLPGTTTFTFAVTLTGPTAGGVTFDIATADGTAEDDTPATEDEDYVAQSLTGQSIPAASTGPFNFVVTINRDFDFETNETFFVNLSNIVGADPGDTQGQGTITNDDVALVFIHDVQGNGASTPNPGTTVAVEGVVIGNYQGTDKLRGFFLQEEDTDADADPLTSEGLFIFCSACPTAVAEGQRVRVTGSISEFFNMTQITASTAGAVVVTNAGDNLGQVTPATIDLPVVGVVNDFYEPREGMLVSFVDTLTVSEYFEMARFGHLELFEGGRPLQFTEASPPSVAGYAAHLDSLDRRRVIVDDDNNRQNAFLPAFGGPAAGSQFVFHPRANGGFSVGTQATDFFRGGDLINGLTGVLHWSFPGTGVDTWRIRPAAATPATFTVGNPRPATPPAVSGAIRAVSMNLLNYFTTLDTGGTPCGPSANQGCRGANSVAELDRQRERAALVICGLNAHVLGLMELENTTASDTITDLLTAVNAQCGGADPYDFVDTGGTLGTDAIRVALIYRSATLSAVGPAVVDTDAIHNRPPTAQTFDVVDPANTAFGQRFTVVANHFKSKGGCPGPGPDDDDGDGAGCFNATRTAQATRLLTWVNGTVVPAAGDPDVLLLGDFNSYAEEDPITTLEAGGYTDVAAALLGLDAYSYLFDGQLGHLDYAFVSAGLAAQVGGVGPWHINADEVPLFDYNDEVFDSPGEASFEEKPDGSALVPPRVVFQPASPYRAADHDPVLVGLFPSGSYYTLTPCRATDTRAGSPLQDGVPTNFALKGVCGIPASATSVVLNLTAIGPTGAGDLTIHAADVALPAFSTLPFPADVTRALFATVSLAADANGAVTVQPAVAGSGTVHVTIDVMGYFQ